MFHHFEAYNSVEGPKSRRQIVISGRNVEHKVRVGRLRLRDPAFGGIDADQVVGC